MIFKILFGIFWYFCISLAVMIFMMLMTRNNEKEDRFYADGDTIAFGFFWPLSVPFSILIVCYEGFKYLLKKIEKNISQDS